MNASTCLCLFGVFALLWSGHAEETVPAGTPGPQPAFRDAPTHRDLSATYEKAKGEDPLVREFAQDPALMDGKALPPPLSLLERSDLLVHGGRMTLVPKGAVVYVPDFLQDRLTLDETASIVSWREFYRLNSHWIQPLNVTVEQALGEKPLPPGLLERLTKAKKVLVATCSDQPITLLSTPSAESTAESPEEKPTAP